MPFLPETQRQRRNRETEEGIARNERIARIARHRDEALKEYGSNRSYDDFFAQFRISEDVKTAFITLVLVVLVLGFCGGALYLFSWAITRDNKNSTTTSTSKTGSKAA